MKKSPLNLAAAILITAPLNLSAVTLYWDLTDGVAGAGGPTPSGTWSTGTASWNDLADGSGTLVNWTDNSDAVFSAESDATGTYTVTTNAPTNALSITVEDGRVFTNTTSANRIAVGTGGLTINSGATYSFLGSTQSLQPATATTPTLTLNGGTLENRTGPNGSTFLNAAFQVVLAGTGGTFNMPTPGATSFAFIYRPTVGISGSGGLTLRGNTIQFRADIANVTYSYTGPTTLTSTGGAFEFRQNITGTNNVLPVGTDLTVNANAIFNLGLANAQVASLSGSGTVAAANATRTFTISGSTPANDSTFDGVMQNFFNDLNTTPNTAGVLALTKSGTSALTLTGLNSQTGATTLNDGTITVDASGALSGATASLAVSGGVLNLNNTAQSVGRLTGTGGTINLGSGHTLTIAPTAASTYSGTIGGPGGIIKNGTSTEIFSGPNTYEGTTVVNVGRLQVNSATALGSTTGNTQITAGAELLFDGVAINFTINEPIQIAGVGLDGGAVTIQNSSTPTLSGPITLTANAQVTVSGSSTGIFNNPNAFTALANESLTLQGGSGAGGGGTISGVIALGDGGLTKLQGGKWVLSAANTYAGATTISAGTLVAASDSALGTAAGTTTVASGAALGFQGDINYATAEAVSIAGAGITSGGAINNISGDNTFAGPITMAAESSIGVADGTLTLTNALGGAFNLTKVGPGALTLSGPQSYSSLRVDAGIATLDSSLPDATITNESGMLNINANANDSTINANSSGGTNIHASQTLTALNIGATGVVVISTPPPADESNDLATANGGPAVISADVAQAVPEPGSISLLMLGALGFLFRRERKDAQA